MITRRSFTGAGITLLGLGLSAAPGAAEPTASWPARLAEDFARIEAASRGRLGVAVLDTENRALAGHRADEPFPMCSTFKVLAAGAILRAVDAGTEDLSRRVRFRAADVVVYSPVTARRTGGDGMTLAELCQAAITRSDNTAGNLLLGQIGGPAGLTRFARSIGDGVTRLDRTETDLNEAVPGDPRDTTTPTAMLANLDRLILGPLLSTRSRGQLAAWLEANQTGGTRLRVGLPPGWRVGDKTGAGGRGSTNDVGVLWRPERKPILAAVYLTDTDAPVERRNAAIADVARAVAAAVRA